MYRVIRIDRNALCYFKKQCLVFENISFIHYFLSLGIPTLIDILGFIVIVFKFLLFCSSTTYISNLIFQAEYYL